MSLAAIYVGGGAAAVELTELPDPSDPGSGQVVIRVTAFPVHGDEARLLAASGVAAAPRRLGAEATGFIAGVGAGVDGLRTGMRVSAFPVIGAWAEYVVADAQFVVPVPDSVPDEVAAQMLINPLTMLLLRRVADEHYATGYDGVLINGDAVGPVGRLLTAGLSHHQIPTISLADSLAATDALRQRFPHIPVVDTSTPGWQQQVTAAAAGGTVGIAFDTRGDSRTVALMDLLSVGGTLALYGFTEPTVALPGRLLLGKAITVRGVTASRWAETIGSQRRASDVATAAAVAQVLADQFDVAAVYPIDELAAAVTHAADPATQAIVLVRP